MGKLTKNQKLATAKIEAGKLYTLKEASALVKEVTTTKFDASVDIDVRLGVDPRKAPVRMISSSASSCAGMPVRPTASTGYFIMQTAPKPTKSSTKRSLEMSGAMKHGSPLPEITTLWKMYRQVIRCAMKTPVPMPG